MARPAVNGPMIYDKVEQLLKDRTVENQNQAFKLIMETEGHFGIPITGKSSGTVAAGYYREKKKRQNGNGSKKAATRRSQPQASSVDHSDIELVALAKSFVEKCEAMVQENAELKSKLAAIRSELNVQGV